MPGLIDDFIPRGQIAERHETTVAAPADLVFQVACEFDLRSIGIVDAIFWLREKILGGTPAPENRPRGLVAETLALGWGRLAERPGRELVMGAVAQPWLADVVFRPVPPEQFAAFTEPGLVKIAWTLEVEPIDATHTSFRSQTRALPTDDSARRKFKRYWRGAGAGIVLIRWLALPAVRREAERRFRAASRDGSESRELSLARATPSLSALSSGRSRGLRLSTCRASREERQRPIPADSIVPEPLATVTNAITIHAPPDQVWPWLAQMGGGRAGWYSFDRVDNGGQPSALRIVPEIQHLALGDILPAIPGAKDAFVVASVQPPRELVLTVPRGGSQSRVSWAYLLEPRDHDCTRLVVRGRVSPHWLDPGSKPPSPAREPIFIERVYGALARIPPPVMLPIARLGHRIMLARQLRGIRRRAEAVPPAQG